MKKLLLVLLAIASSINFTNAQWVQTPVTSADITCFTTLGANVFAGSFAIGIFKSSDNGVSWSNVNNGLPDSSATNVRALGTIGRKVFVGTFNGLFVSVDSGASWAQVADSLVGRIIPTSFAQMGSNLFEGTLGAGVFLSTDSGTTWAAVDSGLTDAYPNALAVSGTNIFAGTYQGIFLSADTGKTWTPVDSGLTNLNINTLAAIGTNVFTANNGDIFLSVNNGASWAAVDSNIAAVLGLAAIGANIFAATEGDGMLFSKNNGATWTEENTGLINLNLSTIVINGSYIYAGTFGFGVWRFPLSGIVLSTENVAGESNNISIYPNPATNQLTIRATSFQNESVMVSVINVLGQEALSPTNLTKGAGDATIDISKLTAGIYFLEMKCEGGSVVKKFVKSAD